MISRVQSAIAKVLTLVRRHGGGLQGTRWLVGRSYRLLRTLGLAGLLERYRMMGAAPMRTTSPTDFKFPEPVPSDQITLTVGVMVHVFYPDLVDEIVRYLANMPGQYVLMVSVADDHAADLVAQKLNGLAGLHALHIRKVPNRGRDLAPMFVAFREQILTLDVVAHLHTKKSLYTGTEQHEWRRGLFDSLFGSKQRLEWILGSFQAEPRLGLVFPESPPEVPYWGHTWLQNETACRALGQRLGIEIEHGRYFDFPAGSMFWARVAALRPLFDMKLEWTDFPIEAGQTDGTLQHALERMLAILVRTRGWMYGVLARDSDALDVEGDRNWQIYFQASVANRIIAGDIEADIVSVDIFDTLLVRTFLTPQGARDYMAWQADRRLGVPDFASIRAQAEQIARSRSGRDVGIADIYRVMAGLPAVGSTLAADLLELELRIEALVLRPRRAVVDSIKALSTKGTRVVAISDMYLGSGELSRVMPEEVRSIAQKWYISCETGWRKDNGEAWRRLPEQEHVRAARWLHVGDNETADIQMPHDLGYAMPVHVMRPPVLFDAIPQLRVLRPRGGSHAPWQEQLWLGLLANHFTGIADSEPATLLRGEILKTPETVGYAVLGPLVMDYLAWLSRLSLEHDSMRLLFLSREGHLLDRAFSLLRKADPALSNIQHTYLFASRRGVGTPSLHGFQDLEELLGSSFEGSLMELLTVRLGIDTASRVRERLGSEVLQRPVYLPEMRDQIIEQLRPAAKEILHQAAIERSAYLRYWQDSAGPGIVADLGYAGTIQAHLSRLVGTGLGGAYFATNARIGQVERSGGWSRARYWREDDAIDAPPVMQYHLLLETFLTSPDGQFSHFRQLDGRVQPVFLAREHGPRSAELIAGAHDGALRFIEDACRVAGDASHLLAFDAQQVQQPLRCMGSGFWRSGAWLSELGMVDAFTGRGAVPVGTAA